MKSILIIFLFITTLLAGVKPYQIKLVNPLDRPANGYCLDIFGSGK